MRHRKSGRKLGRSSSHREAMFRNMVTSFLEFEKIETTDAKAKELRMVAERLVTLGKRHALSVVAAGADAAEQQRRNASRVAAIRQAARVIRRRDVLQKLFSELGERYQSRPGGYTRIMRTGRRLGDGAEMAIIELIPDGQPAAQPTISDVEQLAPT